MRKLPSFAGVALALTLVAPVESRGQDVFRSTQAANLPTAMMLNGGNWQFEISHRFDTPISAGSTDFWGLDGPVRNRLGLIYAPSDRVMLGVVRSNFLDNVELNARIGGASFGSEAMPVEVALQAGVAWNTDFAPNDNESQAYVQGIVNALVADRLAVGLLPTILHNPRIVDPEAESAFVLGITGQLYFNSTWSFLGEWIVAEARTGLEYDAGTFGVEIRTRGHHFKLLVTNQASMNLTHVLAGTPLDFTDPDVWRLGFNIQRLLPL